MSVYDFSYKSLEGKECSLSDYSGKVLLIVNTASKCGFTPQYEGLEALYEKYKAQGFEVIGFPCNQFGEQEPGTEKEISEFCSVRYGVSFPLSEKVDVREESAAPLFKYLCSEKGFDGFGKGVKSATLTAFLKAKYGKSFSDNQIKWNFTKFLIDKSGKVYGRYEPTVEPSAMEADIEKLLAGN